MTITLDATSSSVSSGNETSRSWSHTVGTSKGGRCLFVTFATGGNADSTGISITYGGVAMTVCADIANTANDLHAAIYYLVNPPTGSNTVAISWTGSTSGAFSALSLFGVSGGSPVHGSAVTQALTTGAVSLTIPIPGGGWAIDAVSVALSDAGLSVGAGQTVLVNNSTWHGAASYEQETPGSSSIAMTWNKAVGRNSIACGVAIKPSSGQSSPAVSPFMRL